MTAILGRIRLLLMYGLMAFVWLLFLMIYTEKFIPPFKGLVPFLMPWKGLYSIPAAADIEARISIMQALLEKSTAVADAAFWSMMLSFALFSGYLTFLYQQRQRRARENRMLLVKNQEISRRNEFIRYISATIGHEFKNNLGRVKRRVDLIEALPPDVRLRVDANFEKLFADIDVFKKIADEREASLIDFAKVDLVAMLGGLGAHYSDIVETSFAGCDRPCSIFASQSLMKTVFENLFDNAVKYKKPGQDRARLLISCGMDFDGRRRYVSISFKDEGVGMDEEQADRCFYKGKVSEDGWGQGLYFAKYVVGLHAGKIRVGKEYTAKGRGAEIIIHLPYVEESLSV